MFDHTHPLHTRPKNPILLLHPVGTRLARTNFARKLKWRKMKPNLFSQVPFQRHYKTLYFQRSKVFGRQSFLQLTPVHMHRIFGYSSGAAKPAAAPTPTLDEAALSVRKARAIPIFRFSRPTGPLYPPLVPFPLFFDTPLSLRCGEYLDWCNLALTWPVFVFFCVGRKSLRRESLTLRRRFVNWKPKR